MATIQQHHHMSVNSLVDGQTPKQHVFSRISYIHLIVAFAIDHTRDASISITYLIKLAGINSAFREAVQRFVPPEVWMKLMRYPGPSQQFLSRLTMYADCSWLLACMTVKGRWNINEANGFDVLRNALDAKNIAAAVSAIRLRANLNNRLLGAFCRTDSDVLAEVLEKVLQSGFHPMYDNQINSWGRVTEVPVHELFGCQPLDRPRGVCKNWRLLLAILRHRFWPHALKRDAPNTPPTHRQQMVMTSAQYGGRDPASRNEDGHTPLGVAIVSKDRAEIIHWAAATELQLRLGRPPGEDLRFDPKHLLCMQGIHVGGKYTPMQHALLVAADVELADFLGTVIGDGSLLDERTCRALLEEAMALARQDETLEKIVVWLIAKNETFTRRC